MSWTRKWVDTAARSVARELCDDVNFGVGEERMGSNLPAAAVVLLDVIGDV